MAKNPDVLGLRNIGATLDTMAGEVEERRESVNGILCRYYASSHRDVNVSALRTAIEGDEFNDLAQIDARGDIDDVSVDFVKRNIRGDVSRRLECGCGSGRLIPKGIYAHHYCEPSYSMIRGLTQTIQDFWLEDLEKPEVHCAVTECIPIEDSTMDTVIFMNGFFQVRSDYESLIEINRVLTLGGHFVFNILTDDSMDIICGRVLGLYNYVRVVKEFGFEPVEVRDNGHLCFRKATDFHPEMLRKLQFVKSESPDLYRLRNFYAPRDGHLL